MKSAHEPASQELLDLRNRVLRELEDQGFMTEGGGIRPRSQEKNELRGLHASSVAHLRSESRHALRPYEDRLLKMLLPEEELDARILDPEIELIVNKSSESARLFRWAALHWSIPISAGYGRRLRFLVRDRAHGNALVGIIGLGDPVFALSARDTWIGWDADQRKERLRHVMDAFVLGSVPPYSRILGGKLVALLALSREVGEAFQAKYHDSRSLISDRTDPPLLAAVTTTSALGRSSVYNRLRYPNGDHALRSLGMTKGTGDFQFSNGLYSSLRELARDAESSARNVLWPGVGPRNRRETVRIALGKLGLSSETLRNHGVHREVFIATRISNAREFLCGLDSQPADDTTYGVEDLAHWWRERWMLPRLHLPSRDQPFDPESWRIWQD